MIRQTESIATQASLLATVALVHFGFAKVSTFGVTAPFEVSLLWLPAGLAVAACLSLGWRATIAVFAGAFANNLSYDTTTAAAFVVAIAIAAQSAATSWLIGRALGLGLPGRTGAPSSLYSLRAFVVFLGGTALGSVTAPTIGSLVLLASGAVAVHTFWLHWLGWWVGDVLGVAVLAPIAFQALASLTKRPGLGSWRLAVAVSVVSFGFVIAATYLALYRGAVVTLPGGLASDEMLVLVGLMGGVALTGVGTLLIRVERILAERELDREQLRQNAARLAVASRASRMTTWEWDLASGTGICSPELYRQLGFEPNAFAADCANWASRVHPDDLAEAEPFLREHLFERGGDFHGLEFRMRTKSGSWIWLSASAAIAERDANGRPLSLIGANVDITERKRAEEKLRRSEANLSEAQRLAKIGSWEFDIPRNVLTWSDELYRIFEVAPTTIELDYDAFMEFVHPEDRAAVNQVYRTSIENRCPYEIGHRLRFADGRIKHVREQGVTFYDEHGTPIRSVGTCQDVTEQALAEERIRELQKLDAIGQLTGGLAHDFNNLLAVVVGNLDLLREQLPAEEKLQRRLHAALDAALRGAEVTKALLAVARRQPLQVEVRDLNALIAEMLPLVRSSAGSAVTVRSQLWDRELPARVDAAGLSNAVLNLVINARDAMKEQPGERLLVLRTRQKQVESEGDLPLVAGAYAVLEVEDSGLGMREDVKERAFEPFFTTKDRGHGTGLGLAMVRGFAEQLGGTTRIESAPGRGTTVQLYLPLDERKGSRDVAPERANVLDTAPESAVEAPLADSTDARSSSVEFVDADTRGIRAVLVVDDEEPLCELACEWIESMGFRARGVHSAAEALAALEEGAYDLLFTDVVMPGGMDGLALASAARERWQRLRVLVASGYARGLAGTRRLPWSVLHKPYRRADLQKAIAALAAHQPEEAPDL